MKSKYINRCTITGSRYWPTLLIAFTRAAVAHLYFVHAMKVSRCPSYHANELNVRETHELAENKLELLKQTELGQEK